MLQWALLQHHGVHCVNDHGVRITDIRRVTCLSAYSYEVSSEAISDRSLPGPMWPHNQTRRIQWVAQKYGAKWWVSKSNRDMPWNQDWVRVGSLKSALAYVARRLHVRA